MTKSEAGKLGGLKTASKYGKEYMVRWGNKAVLIVLTIEELRRMADLKIIKKEE